MKSGKIDIKEGVLIEKALKLLNQRWVSAADIESIPAAIGVKDPDLIAVKIFILNQLLEIYRQTPDMYFREDDHRENVLEAVQEALDDLIEEEEESLEDDEDDDDDVKIDFDF